MIAGDEAGEVGRGVTAEPMAELQGVKPNLVAVKRDLAPVVGGVCISHPDRIIYPDLNITKLDLARYYDTIGKWIVPHVRRRPLTLVHCPNGLLAACHYMRHTKVWGPSVLRRVKIRERTKVGEYLVADNIAAVVGLVQMGVVEIHTWNSTDDDVDRPNRIVWDLDPGQDVSWAEVVAAARQVRAVLDALRLRAWVKTTGGRGLHVVMPLVAQRPWSECLDFSRDVARALVRTDPTIYTLTFVKRGRESKILIDYLRNNRTNTSVAAFSSRARQGAPVSVPISWKELGSKLDPSAFTILTVPRRLTRLRDDPWRDYWTTSQRISDEALAVLKAL